MLLNGTYQWLNQSSTADNQKLYAGQVAVNFKLPDDGHVMVGGTYYGFDNMKGDPVLDWQNNNNTYGNSSVNKVSGSTTNKLYATDFQTWEAFAEAGVDIGLPVTVYGAYAQNTDPSKNNTGYTVGLKVGKCKDPNTFEVGYDWRHVEKDVFPGALPDDDAWGGGTDGEGHKIWANYMILKNLQFGVTYFLTQKSIASGETSVDYNHLMVDLLAKF